MKTSILQKCLEELDKDSPRLDYIRGMLETFIELTGESSNGRTTGFGPVNLGSIPSPPKGAHSSTVERRSEDAKVGGSTPPVPTVDEGEILTAKAKSRVDVIREMAEKSTEIA